MRVFDSAEPVLAVVEVATGEVRFAATERGDTEVEVRPADPGRDADVRAAEGTLVEFDAGRLLVRTPKARGLGIFGRTGSVVVTIGLPTGSRVDGKAQLATFRGTGRLGETRVRTSMGDVRLERVARLDVNTGSGAVDVGEVDDTAEVTTGSGEVRLREVGGRAVVWNSNGPNWLGRVAGEVRVRTANGDVRVERAESGMTATSANGNVRVGVVRGRSTLRTACGEIEIAVPAGTAARLDLHTAYGSVLNGLTGVAGPGSGDDTAEVTARTSAGDIIIRRA